MAISTADFKNGMCIVNNGKMCTIVEFQHVKPGKGGAFVRTKLRDMLELDDGAHLAVVDDAHSVLEIGGRDSHW